MSIDTWLVLLWNEENEVYKRLDNMWRSLAYNIRASNKISIGKLRMHIFK